MSKYDITALGETLIDFTYSGISASGMKLFEQNPGGAPANFLSAAAKFGLNTAFIGKAGSDMHGLFLRETMANAGISTEGMILADDVFTTLAFVALTPDGERSFSFARKPGADTCLRIDEINGSIKQDIIENTAVFHVGSLSLTDEPARGATVYAVETAKKAGAVISYDPNYRASLWASREAAAIQIRSLLGYVDMIKISDEETELTAGMADPEAAARKLTGEGIRCAAVTLGKAGALVCVNGRCKVVPACEGAAVDTTGAGDAFWGGFMYSFVRSGLKPCEVALSDAVEFARFGNAAATLCVGKRGAIPAMPALDEAEALCRSSYM